MFKKNVHEISVTIDKFVTANLRIVFIINPKVDRIGKKPSYIINQFMGLILKFS